jgi:hypothetical protein
MSQRYVISNNAPALYPFTCTPLFLLETIANLPRSHLIKVTNLARIDMSPVVVNQMMDYRLLAHVKSNVHSDFVVQNILPH